MYVAVQLMNGEVIQVCVWYLMNKNNEATPSFWKFPFKRFPTIITRVKLLSLTQTLK